MARKKTMATTKKRKQKAGKVVEFFRAISGFWPVWLSMFLTVVVVFGYQKYDNNQAQLTESDKIVVEQPVNITPEQIRVIGELVYLQPEMIKRLVSEKITSGFISSDLNQIRELLEAEAWVKQASIKRLPPDILQLQITEQKPMLRWGDKGLISKQGKIFKPEHLQQFASLATIISDEKSIQKGLSFLKKSIPVIQKLGLNFEQIVEDKLGAWEIKTTQGVVLKFGRKNLQHRLQILEKLWTHAKQKGSLKTIDLRYSNGAAVSYL